MGSVRFLKAQVGLQTAFGTPITPTIQLPLTGNYDDQRVHHVAEYDAGTWTPTTMVALEKTLSQLTLTGTASFEVLPVLLNSMWEDVAPSVTYLHTYTINPAAVAVPKPLTALVGAVGENLGGTGPAVKLPDLYVKTLKLSSNINSPMVALDAQLFGTNVDDNAGAGYAFIAVGLPATIEPINGLKGIFNIDDPVAGTGGTFATMTAFVCAITDWSLTLNSGLDPQYCLTNNVTTHIGYRNLQPNIELALTVRTTAANYLLVKAKSDARAYQELQLTIAGSGTHVLTVNLTGRFTSVPSASAREGDEVVMKAVFRAETPHTQITTPHWAAIMVNSTNNWT
jgi:hypothetical protein